MLLKELKQHFIQAMKEKNSVKKSILSVVLGKIDNEGKLKKEVDASTEAQVVLQALQSFHKNLVKTKAEFEGKTDEKSKAFLVKTIEEIKILEELLPQKMSYEQLENLIKNYKESGLNQKEILTKLKEEHNGLYDGKAAFELSK